MLGLKFTKKRYFYFLILLLFVVPSVYSLVLPGFFLSDDGEWMVIRFSAFYQALADGQFPVRFLGRLNYGYGYPVTNFLYPGFMYLAVPLQILGLGFVNSIKIILFISMVGGGIFTYFWLSKLFDRMSALVGAIFYTYAPYHLFDLYKRGSVGEILSLMWVTFVLWAIEERNKFLISVGIFLLAISHNSMLLLFAPLLFIYALVKRIFSLKESIMMFGLGLLMSSFFTIPAITELKFTNFSKIEISNVSEYFAPLNLIGISSLIVLFLSLFVIYLKKTKVIKEVYLFVIFAVISIFLSLSFSNFIWNFLPSSLIQFPFRMLSYLVLASAYLSAFVLFSLGDKKKILLPLLLILVFLSAFNFLWPNTRFDKGDSYYSTNEATTTVKDEYMPFWVKEKPQNHFDNKVDYANGIISDLTYNSKRINFQSFGDRGVAKINTIYYPGWQAVVNGNKSDISFDNDQGVMEVNLPKGKNKVEFQFSETPLRLFSDFLSIISFTILIIWNRKTLLNKNLLRRIK